MKKDLKGTFEIKGVSLYEEKLKTKNDLTVND